MGAADAARNATPPPIDGVPPPGVEVLAGRPTPCGLPSAAVVARTLALAVAFDAHAPPLAVLVRGTVLAPPSDALRPEVALCRQVAALRRRPAPGPEVVVLAVLVGDDEAALAARAARCGALGIPEVWLLPVRAGALGVRYAAPHRGRYAIREPIYPGERLAPRAAPTLEVVPVPDVSPGGRSRTSRPPGR